MKLKRMAIQIVHDPEGTFIGLITPERRYAWPTDQMPGIITALRKCAGGEPAPDGCKGMVFAVPGGLVALTEEPPKVSFANVHGEATKVIDARAYSHVVSYRTARELADGFRQTYRKLRPTVTKNCTLTSLRIVSVAHFWLISQPKPVIIRTIETTA